jgi:rubredoxin
MEVLMAVYKCMACGYVFDEEKEGRSIRDIDVCPRCHQPDDRFVLVEETEDKKDE